MSTLLASGRWLAAALLLMPAACAVTSAPTDLEGRLRAQARTAPLIVAHRGDSGSCPENTMPSFASALKRGAHIVELDFHETKDGVLYCMHDDTLDRTTNVEQVLGRTNVRTDDVTLAELKQLDAGSWKAPEFAGTPVPTLAEVLDAISPHAVMMIEHKAGPPEELVRILREKELVENVIVMSFDWKWLGRAHALEPRLFIAKLGNSEMTDEHRDAIQRSGVRMIHWNLRKLRFEDIQRLRAQGYLTCSYTVNDDAGMVGGARLGLDAITTDWPGRLRELIERGLVRRR
ncbi:MAG: glycerophosphodiester phosphodiesterase [Planctomycetota bacterium]